VAIVEKCGLFGERNGIAAPTRLRRLKLLTPGVIRPAQPRFPPGQPGNKFIPFSMTGAEACPGRQDAAVLLPGWVTCVQAIMLPNTSIASVKLRMYSRFRMCVTVASNRHSRVDRKKSHRNSESDAVTGTSVVRKRD
jgi:hypothetical protein